MILTGKRAPPSLSVLLPCLQLAGNVGCALSEI